MDGIVTSATFSANGNSEVKCDLEKDDGTYLATSSVQTLSWETDSTFTFSSEAAVVTSGGKK